MIPKDLPEPFTSKDFAKKGKISATAAGRALNTLTYTGTVKRIGKKGNAILYTL